MLTTAYFDFYLINENSTGKCVVFLGRMTDDNHSNCDPSSDEISPSEDGEVGDYDSNDDVVPQKYGISSPLLHGISFKNVYG